MTAEPIHHWHAINAGAARTLSDARQQVHHAIQFGTALGISYLPAAADDGHTSLEWDSALRALVSHSVATSTGAVAVGIRVEDLTLLVTSDGELAAALPLHGQTLVAATTWLRATLAKHGVDSARLTTERHYTIPSHPIAAGATFDASNRMAFEELAHWLSNAAGALRMLASETPGASVVRLWPHHFDIATLVSLGGGRSTGAGLAGGDGYYDEPYFYVNVHPQPVGALPDAATLGGGSWHTHEWIGAVLPGSRVTGDATGQHALVHAYLRASLATCRDLAQR